MNLSSTPFKKWAKEIPTRADWVFFESRDQARDILGPKIRLFFKNELLNNRRLFSFSERSWHGYAASRAACFARLPSGRIEQLAPQKQKLLAQTHHHLDVPSLLLVKKISPVLRQHFPSTGKYLFATVAGIRKLSMVQRVHLRKCWIELHPWMELPPKTSLSAIHPLAQSEVTTKGLDHYLNFYFDHTGPNCFATAAAISCHARFSIRVAGKWMSGKSFISALRKAGYSPQNERSRWRRGDVAVFIANGGPVHAAYCLGHKTFAEKGGQDFYNPIALTNLKTLLSDWKGTTLTTWSKNNLPSKRPIKSEKCIGKAELIQ